MLLALTTALVLAASPKVGAQAPDFTVKDIDGATLRLSELVEKGPVVLAFFPKAFTSGCTKEVTAYRDRYAEIQKHGGTVIAVSSDGQEQQKKFRDSIQAPYPFVADADATLIKLYDVKAPIISIARRVTFVIGKGRTVLAISEGGDAVDPSGAVAACSVKPAAGLEFVTGGADAGAH